MNYDGYIVVKESSIKPSMVTDDYYAASDYLKKMAKQKCERYYILEVINEAGGDD